MAETTETTQKAPKVPINTRVFVKDKKLDFENKLKLLTPYEIPKYYEECGLELYLGFLDDLHYEEWLEFYKNATLDSAKPHFFETEVKGIKIRVNEKLIELATGFQREGVKVYSQKWMKKLTMKGTNDQVTEDGIFNTIFQEDTPRNSNVKYRASCLIPICRVLHGIQTCTFLSRKTHLDRLKDVDKYVLFNVIQGNRINMPHLMYHYLRNAIIDFQKDKSNGLVSGILVTKILKSQRMSLSAPSLTKGRLAWIDIGPFKRMKGQVQITLFRYNTEIGGEWRTKKGKKGQVEEESAKDQGEPSRTKKKAPSKRKTIVDQGESSRTKKKGKQAQPQDSSEYVAPGYNPSPPNPISLDVGVTPSEADVYDRLREDVTLMTEDTYDYAPSQEAPSEQMKLVKESARRLARVLKDAAPELEHVGKNLKRKRREIQLEEIQEEGSVRQEIQIEEENVEENSVEKEGGNEEVHDLEVQSVETQPGRSVNTLFHRKFKGKIRKARGGKLTIITPKKRRKLTNEITTLFSQPRRSVTPPEPIQEEGIHSQSTENISNVIMHIVQEVQQAHEEAPESANQVPDVDAELILNEHQLVEEVHAEGLVEPEQEVETEIVQPEAPSQELEQDWRSFPIVLGVDWRSLPVVLGEGQPLEVHYIIERSEVEDLEIHTAQYGFYHTYEIGIPSPILLPVLSYHPPSQIYFYKFTFICIACRYVPYQYAYLMLQFIPDLFFYQIAIPRLAWNMVTPNFIPEHVRWIGVRRNYFLGFILSIEPWEQELTLHREILLNLLGHYMDLDAEFARIEAERASVWRRLCTLRLI